MAQNHKMSEAESLKRSHSAVSNGKLTLVCLLCALSLSVCVAGIATVGTGLLSDTVATVAAAVGGALFALSLFAVSRFRR